ncbi:hypothetical protein BMS3Abin10_01115 [bacterium BMS3Abin10]|nr:hypothetical protein BMS3Abin10_01115 [bacterium BMS3Abin10]GBE38137.1 hypothetical protein BMS3Bbin08_00739 [bacterium BMS3Bbin08]
MPKHDLVRIRHILDAVREALSFTSGKTRLDLNTNRMMVLSLVKEIEIIGEAAGQVTEETKNTYKTIPWLDMIDMRNHLIHVYFEVDLDILWDTVVSDLPPLIEALDEIVPSL